MAAVMETVERVGRADEARPRTYPCIESTRDFRVGPYLVRVWRNELSVDDAVSQTNGDIVAVVSGAAWKDAGALAEAVARFERVNAVQVIATHDANKGLVLYVEWP